MGIAQIILLILSLLKELPEIIALVKSIIEAIRKMRDARKIVRTLFVLKRAVEVYKASGDFSELNKLRDSLSHG